MEGRSAKPTPSLKIVSRESDEWTPTKPANQQGRKLAVKFVRHRRCEFDSTGRVKSGAVGCVKLTLVAGRTSDSPAAFVPPDNDPSLPL